MLLWRYLYLSRSRTRAGVLDCALQAVTGQGEVTAVPGVTCLTFRLGTELLIVVLHKAASFKVKQDVGIFIPGILYPRRDGVMSYFLFPQSLPPHCSSYNSPSAFLPIPSIFWPHFYLLSLKDVPWPFLPLFLLLFSAVHTVKKRMRYLPV